MVMPSATLGKCTDDQRASMIANNTPQTAIDEQCIESDETYPKIGEMESIPTLQSGTSEYDQNPHDFIGISWQTSSTDIYDSGSTLKGSESGMGFEIKKSFEKNLYVGLSSQNTDMKGEGEIEGIPYTFDGDGTITSFYLGAETEISSSNLISGRIRNINMAGNMSVSARGKTISGHFESSGAVVDIDFVFPIENRKRASLGLTQGISGDYSNSGASFNASYRTPVSANIFTWITLMMDSESSGLQLVFAYNY